jgi:hypothetical protein
MSDIGMSKEGASSVRPPLLTGVNYASWKGKMEAYLCQIHDRAWMAIEDGYAPPMMTPTGGGEQVLKPKAIGQMESLRLQSGIGRHGTPFYVQWTKISTN